MGLNPSTLIMERDQDFPQPPSIPLSSKLDGALTPLCFPSTKAATKPEPCSGWAWLSLAQLQAGSKGCLQALCYTGTKKFSTLESYAELCPQEPRQSLPLANSRVPLVLLQEETCFLCIQA